MKYLYPVIFKEIEDGFYMVDVPDLPGCITEGSSLNNAFEMAQDAIAMWICDAEDNKEKIPVPSNIHSISCEKSDVISMVLVDTSAYRIALDNRVVKKNLTIPYWIEKIASERHINFSRVLMDALVSGLGLQEEMELRQGFKNNHVLR